MGKCRGKFTILRQQRKRCCNSGPKRVTSPVNTAAQERRALERCHLTRLDVYARLDKTALPESPEDED